MLFAIEAIGVQGVLANMDARLAAVRDLTPDLLIARDEFGAIEAEKFASGQGFRANSPGTQVYRAQEGLGSKVMDRTGALKGALSNPKIFSQTAVSIRTGTDLKQGYFQQMGFTQKWFVDGIAGLYWLAQRGGHAQAPNKPINLQTEDRARIAAKFAASLITRLAV